MHLGICSDAESEFGIHFVSGSTVNTSLVLMSRTDVKDRYPAQSGLFTKIGPVGVHIFDQSVATVFMGTIIYWGVVFTKL